jgi:hypothetical protein
MASNRFNHAENFQYQTKHSPVKSDTSHRDESARQVNSIFPHCHKCRIHSILPSRTKNDSYSNETEQRIITFSTNLRSYTLSFRVYVNFCYVSRFIREMKFYTQLTCDSHWLIAAVIPKEKCPFHGRHPTRLWCYCRFSSEVTVGVSSNSVFPETLLLADPLLVSKNNHGSSHPCSRKYRMPGW